MPTRSPFLVAGLNNATLETCSGISLSMIPPVMPFIGIGRWCFFTRFAPSTSTCWSSTMRSTVPRLPRSRPVVTMTWSPLRILRIASSSEHFRSERHDLHEALGAQLARHRPEDARADRLELGGQQHRRVRVELDQRAVVAAHALGGAHDHGVVDLAFLHSPARRRVLDAHLDDVADAGIAPLRAAQHLDALDPAGAGVVGHVQYGLHLYHRSLASLASPTWPLGLRGSASIGARSGRSPPVENPRARRCICHNAP